MTNQQRAINKIRMKHLLQYKTHLKQLYIFFNSIASYKHSEELLGYFYIFRRMIHYDCCFQPKLHSKTHTFVIVSSDSCSVPSLSNYEVEQQINI